MKAIYRNTHNGVEAVYPAGAEVSRYRHPLLGDREFRFAEPIFTFADLAQHLEMRQWVVGDFELMQWLLAGHEVNHDPDLYVPFSRAFHLETSGAPRAVIDLEQSFRCPVIDVILAFELGRVTPFPVSTADRTP